MMTPEERVKVNEEASPKAVEVYVDGLRTPVYWIPASAMYSVAKMLQHTIAEAEADARVDELGRCCQAIRVECESCGGAGFLEEERTTCPNYYGLIAAIRKPPADSEVPELGWLYNCGHCKRQLSEKELGPNSVEAATSSGSGRCPWCLYDEVWRVQRKREDG